LIKTGSLDEFGDRGSMLGNVETMLSFAKESNSMKNQTSLFAARLQTLWVRAKPPVRLCKPGISRPVPERHQIDT
ncbi:MAG TPA: hypothetical protein PKZ53_21035, partial [Acidobacteriota bacterium]|nr:hypothetical protein [Acidobacteriota bacterium]